MWWTNIAYVSNKIYGPSSAAAVAEAMKVHLRRHATFNECLSMKTIRREYSALNVNFNGARLDPLGSRSPPYECIKFGYPLRNARFLLLSSNLARERLQIDTWLAAYHTKHCWRAFRIPGVLMSNLGRSGTQNLGFSEFIRYFRLRHTLRVNFRRHYWRWTATTCVQNETDADFLLVLV